jgi:hypothetical protein
MKKISIAQMYNPAAFTTTSIQHKRALALPVHLQVEGLVSS